MNEEQKRLIKSMLSSYRSKPDTTTWLVAADLLLDIGDYEKEKLWRFRAFWWPIVYELATRQSQKIVDHADIPNSNLKLRIRNSKSYKTKRIVLINRQLNSIRRKKLEYKYSIITTDFFRVRYKEPGILTYALNSRLIRFIDIIYEYVNE